MHGKKFAFVFLLIAVMCLVFSTISLADQTVASEPTGLMNDCEKSVVIYSGAEEYRNAYFQKRLNEQFPGYNITIEYMPTGYLAAKLASEGLDTDIDIIYDLDCGYADMLEQYLADLSTYDQSIYEDDCKVESARYLIEYRNGGAIIINPDVLSKKGIEKPTSYHDLLKPEFKGLISMPNPKSSGTGYMFLKSLVNAWGEQEAFDYFDKLAENILQFTSSGSGPVNALIEGEAAVGLGMTPQAVFQINSGANLQILFFEEGSPFCLYGYAIPEGKQNRQEVRDVFDFFYSTLVVEDERNFVPEKVFKDIDFEIENYPTDIPYADMCGNTTEEKLRLLDNWSY